MKQLRINVITNNNQYGLTSDAGILVRYLQQVAESSGLYRFQVCPVSFYCAECGRADINIHLEIPCPLLVHSAPVNILVPNHEWWFRHWQPYLGLFDQVWVKTERARGLFQAELLALYGDNSQLDDKLRLVEWTSPDRGGVTKRETDQALHLAGRSRLKGTEELLDSWPEEAPTLHVIANAESVELPDKKQENIVYYRERLEEADLRTLMQRCALHICPSEDEGYGHYLNEARSCGALIVTVDAEPMRHFTEPLFCMALDEERSVDMGMTLGRRHRFQKTEVGRILDEVGRLDKSAWREIAATARRAYVEQGRRFREALEGAMRSVLPLVESPPVAKLPAEIHTSSRGLPRVCLVTISRNRPQFLPLAILNYTGIDYPQEQLEWVVVDAGHSEEDESSLVETVLRKELAEDMEAGRVRCIRGDPSYSVGKNRNLGVAAATKADFIVMMDDDDIYPPRHLLIKLAYLQHYGKACGYCSNIGCFHIGKYISTINVPPMNYPPERRSAEATLCFRRDFWETRGFCEDDQGEEGAAFLQGRYGECVEYPWKPMIISLLHSSNLSTRVRGLGDTPNGCHFGISDDLFSFVTSLEERDPCVEAYLATKEGAAVQTAAEAAAEAAAAASAVEAAATASVKA